MKLFDRLGKLRDRRRPYCTMIVPAAGESRRMGGGNKLLLPLEGEPVLAHTLRAIDAATLVDEIILATRTECLAEMAELCQRCGLQKPVRVVVGGETRTHSVLAAALEANEKARLIAVHDGARPLIRPEQIDELIRFGERTYATAPAVLVSDTIKRTEPSTGRVLETWTGRPFAVQTPQVFQAELLKAALQSAVNAEVTLTDDCSAVERLGKEVYLTAGDPENIKITRPLDLRLAEAILAERRKQA
ncbi:MAG: 2-C-methyl-D-erythritol 4-phosphate cytidylyltransferase [Oscillospiraceae bacterium]